MIQKNVISIDEHISKDNTSKINVGTASVSMSTQTHDIKPIPMADLIRKFRKRSGISQQALGDMLGVTRNTVVNWEGGKYRPDIDLLVPLCSIFGITLYELFDAEDQTLGVTVHERTLLDQYRKISLLGQRVVDRVIDSILDEESKEKERKLISSVRLVGSLATTAAAGDGYGFNDIPMDGYSFIVLNGFNNKADAILKIRGNSMLPKYESGCRVYVQFTKSPSIGEDVICRSMEGLHIKRLGEEGPYSLNKDEPFMLTSPADRVEIIGRVLGTVDENVDFLSEKDTDILRELKQDEISEFCRSYGLEES